MSIDYERLLLEQRLEAERREDDEQEAWLAAHPDAERSTFWVDALGGFAAALIFFAIAMWIAHKVVYG